MTRSGMWTAEQDAALFRLFIVEGHSASQTAQLLPGPKRTRAAVIGRADRLNFSRGAASAPRIKAPYPKRAAPKQFRRRSQPAPAFVSPKWKDGNSLPPTPISNRGAGIESPNAGPWIDRTAHQCAFPVGDIGGADQWSCCNPTESGQSYCPAHAAIMFNGTPKPNTAFATSKPRRSPSFKEWAA